MWGSNWPYSVNLLHFSISKSPKQSHSKRVFPPMAALNVGVGLYRPKQGSVPSLAKGYPAVHAGSVLSYGMDLTGWIHDMLHEDWYVFLNGNMLESEDDMLGIWGELDITVAEVLTHKYPYCIIFSCYPLVICCSLLLKIAIEIVDLSS
jgi:hypothetical protein